MSGCKSSTVDCSDEYCIIDASQPGKWPQNGFCIIEDQSTKTTTDNYILSADIRNLNSRGGVNYGHVGLAYNVQDADNFDYVYFR